MREAAAHAMDANGALLRDRGRVRDGQSGWGHVAFETSTRHLSRSIECASETIKHRLLKYILKF